MASAGLCGVDADFYINVYSRLCFRRYNRVSRGHHSERGGACWYPRYRGRGVKRKQIFSVISLLIICLISLLV